MVRFIANKDLSAIGDCGPNSTVKESCGVFKYWDKGDGQVKKVGTPEEQCLLHHGQWLNEDDIKKKTDYEMPTASDTQCCICALGYTKCILDGKECKKVKPKEEDGEK